MMMKVERIAFVREVRCNNRNMSFANSCDSNCMQFVIENPMYLQLMLF